jgi:aspartyl-tRNA synthetase
MEDLALIDRLVAILWSGNHVILSLSKNNSGRDVMIDAPSSLMNPVKELHIKLL